MPQRIVDCHTHTLDGAPEKLRGLADRFGFEKFAVLGCPCLAGFANNLEVLLAKALDPDRVYAFGGHTYLPHARDGAAHVRNLRRLIDAGFDGVKLLESKPTIARELRIRADGDELAPTFAMLEEVGLPILWHVGDPASFWDREKAPAFAVEHGWCYFDPSFATLAQLYEQSEAVLKRHPRLQVCFAHFYFTSDDIDHARRMLDSYPNLRFDLTPGREMYGDFLSRSAMWRDFFVQYQDRILFGTDHTDVQSDLDSGLFDDLVALSTGTLTQTGEVRTLEFSGTGLGLPQTVLDKIFFGNVERLYGKTPKPLNPSGVAALLQWHAENTPTDARQRVLALHALLSACVGGA